VVPTLDNDGIEAARSEALVATNYPKRDEVDVTGRGIIRVGKRCRAAEARRVAPPHLGSTSTLIQRQIGGGCSDELWTIARTKTPGG